MPSLVAVAAACTLAPLDLTGLQCDEVRNDCGPELVCLDGQCAARPFDDPDASIHFDENLLLNPGFETLRTDGGVDSWKVGAGRLVTSGVAHSGQRSAKVYSVTVQQPTLSPSVPIAGAATGMTFCATAWVRSEVPEGMDLTLFIRENFLDGGIKSSSGFKVPDVKSSWVKLHEQFGAVGEGSVEVRVSSAKVDAGYSFLVDDAALYRPDSGTCE